MAEVVNQPKSGVGSVFDLPGKSWRIVKENWQMFAVVNIFALLSALMAALGINENNKNSSMVGGYDPSGLSSGRELGALLGVGALIMIIFIAISIFLYAMSTVLELRSSQGEKPDLNKLIEGGKKYWLRLLGLAILSGIIVLIGFVLLIVPGIIALARIAFAPYIMVDRDLGIMDSLKASNEMAKDRFGQIWAAILVLIGLAIVGGIISAVPVVGPLVGTAFTIAISLVLVLRYLEIKSEDKKTAAPPAV